VSRFPAAIKNKSALFRSNIVHVVSVASLPRPFYHPEIGYTILKALDVSWQDLLSFLPAVHAKIDEALEKSKESDGAVLIHWCTARVRDFAVLTRCAFTVSA